MIQQVGHDVERVVAVSRGFILLCSDDLNVVLTHQTTDATVPNLPSRFLQLLSHAWPAIALQAQAVLLTDMGQQHHIIALSLAHWTYPPSTNPTRRDLPDTAEKFHGPDFFPGVDARKSNQLRPANKSLGTLLCNALTVTGSPSFFLTLSSPRAKVGLPCEGGWFLSQRLHAAPTSGHLADAAGPICSTSKAPHPNLVKPAAAVNRY